MHQTILNHNASFLKWRSSSYSFQSRLQVRFGFPLWSCVSSWCLHDDGDDGNYPVADKDSNSEQRKYDVRGETVGHALYDIYQCLFMSLICSAIFLSETFSGRRGTQRRRPESRGYCLQALQRAHSCRTSGRVSLVSRKPGGRVARPFQSSGSTRSPSRRAAGQPSSACSTLPAQVQQFSVLLRI